MTQKKVSATIHVTAVIDGQDGQPGAEGNGIQSVARTYAVSSQATTASDTTPPSDVTAWAAASPATTEAKPYLWAKEVVTYTKAASTTKYYMIGARGQNGIDAQDIEWAYIRTKTNTAPVIAADSSYTDSKGKTYTADDHLPHVTGNSNIESNNSGVSGKTYECTDDPKGVEDEWPYEWEIKREKGTADANGHRAWTAYSGTMTLHNNLAASLLSIDIDNDNDQFGVDADGKVLAQQARSTVVSMAYGTEPQAFTAAPTASLRYDDGTPVLTSVATAAVSDVSPSDAANTQYRATVTIKATDNNTPVFGASGKNGLYVDITGSCAKGGPKIIRFSLAKVMGGASGDNPVIWQLNPSKKSFVFGRDTNNNLTPDSVASNIYVTRTEGNSTTEHTDTSGLTNPPTFSWGFDNSSTAQASGQTIGTAISISNSDAASHSSVWVQLSTGDRETLPILKDGAKGDEGPSGTEYQRRYLSNNSGETPETPYGDNPSQWSTVPTAVSTSNRYRWMTERSRDNGDAAWGDWSTPVIDTYLAEDGRSINVKGTALTHISGNTQPSSVSGSTGDNLLNDSSANDNALLVRVSDWWLAGSVSDGDGYITKDDGHLWIKSTSTEAGSRWTDCGQVKGEKGDSPVILTLRCSAAVVSFKETSQGVTYLPETYSLTLERTEGETTTILNEPPSGYSLKYKEDDGAWYGNQPLGVLTAGSELRNGDVSVIDYGLFKGDILQQHVTVTAEWPEKGDKGDDAVVYSLQCSPAAVNFRSDAVGEFSGNYTVLCKVMKTVGNNTTEVVASSGTYDGMYLKCRKLNTSGNYTSWDAASSATLTPSDALTNNYVAVEFALSANSGMTAIKARASVPIMCDGHRGAPGEPGGAGATGRMFRPRGTYNGSATYVRDNDFVDLVFFDDGVYNNANGARGHYYYISDGYSSNVSGSTHYAPSPTDGNGNTYPYSGGVWSIASDFGVVITQAIFAEYAKMGSAIITGDWMLSQHGTADGVFYNSYDFLTAFMVGSNQKTSIHPYTLFNGNSPTGGLVSVSTHNTTISRSETSHNIITARSLKSGLCYKITCRVPDGYTFSGVPVQIQIDKASTYDPITLLTVSEEETVYTTYVMVPANTTYRLRLVRSSTASQNDTISTVIEQVTFGPQYAVDLLTGLTYMVDAYVKGDVIRPVLTMTQDNSAQYVIYDSAAPATGGNLFFVDLPRAFRTVQITMIQDGNGNLPPGGVVYILLPEVMPQDVGVEMTVLNATRTGSGALTMYVRSGDSNPKAGGYGSPNRWLLNGIFYGNINAYPVANGGDLRVIELAPQDELRLRAVQLGSRGWIALGQPYNICEE